MIVSIETPQYIIQRSPAPQRSFVRQHWVIFSLLALAVVMFVVGRYTSMDVMNAFQGQRQTLVQQNQELVAVNAQQLRRISVLETELKVKDQAIKELQNFITLLFTLF